jgi:pimeloyl-ACP methyl ester carboxylesterase
LFTWARTAKTVPDRLWGVLAAFAVTTEAGRRTRLMGRSARFMLAHLRGRPLPGPEEEALAVFRDQFASKANARSSKRNVRQTPVWGHGYSYTDKTLGPQDNHAFYAEIQQRIGAAWGPAGQAIRAAGLWGSFDPLAKESVLDQWRAALPQIEADLQIFDGETHFIEERRPEEIADPITRLNAPRDPAGTT